MYKSERGQGAIIYIAATLVALIVLGFLSTFRTVKFGTVAVVRQFGALTGEVLAPGAHFIAPWQSLERVSTLQKSYEASDNPNESDADFTDYTVNSQTMDGQQISINYTVLFHVPDDHALSILNTYGSYSMMVENAIKAYSRNLARLGSQEYNANQLYGTGLAEYEAEVRTRMEEALVDSGVVLDNLLIRKISFDPDYVQAIENQQIAQENITTAQFQSEAAEFQRDQAITMAEAEAERIRLMADADAYAISIKGEALRNNPDVIKWQFVQNLDTVQWGILPGDQLNLYMPTNP